MGEEVHAVQHQEVGEVHVVQAQVLLQDSDDEALEEVGEEAVEDETLDGADEDCL